MTVTLSRGNGPKQWQAYRMSDTAPTVVFFRCPFCGSIGNIVAPVTADGHVTSLVACSSGNCGFGYQVYLAGWTEMNRAVADVEPSSTFPPALCQADGAHTFFTVGPPAEGVK